MKHLIVTLAVALCVLFLTGGCLSTKSPSGPPKNANTSDDLDRLGAMYTKGMGITDKREEELPASFKGTVPLHKRAEITSIRKYHEGQQTGEIVHCRVDASFEKIAEFYTRAMTERDWKKQEAEGRPGEIMFSRGDQVLKVRIASQRGADKKTGVVLILYKVVIASEQKNIELPQLIKETLPLMQSCEVVSARNGENSNSAQLMIKAGPADIIAFYKRALAGKGWRLKDEWEENAYKALQFKKGNGNRQLKLLLYISRRAEGTQKTSLRVTLRSS